VAPVVSIIGNNLVRVYIDRYDLNDTVRREILQEDKIE
jgi:hypothetical protein